MLRPLSYLFKRSLKAVSFFLVFGLFGNAAAQDFKKVCSLPSELHESSGLIVVSEDLFVSHNDGGNAPELYFFDSTGKLVRTVWVDRVSNKDWEDITQDGNGNIYLGDFGNNNQTRKDLKIYKLPPIQTWSTDTVQADSIMFSFADQTAFPPDNSRKVYDCEAMACWNDSIYLFTKNWSSPFTGFTLLYVLPTTPGDYKLMPRDSVFLGKYREFAWVTGASISDDKLFLVGTTYVWEFDWSEGVKWDKMTAHETKHVSQKEAIDVIGSTVFITDESTGGYGNLYRLKSSGNSGLETFKSAPVRIVKSNSGWILLNPSEEDLKVKFYGMDGRILAEFRTSKKVEELEYKILSVGTLKPGIYGLVITGDKAIVSYQKITYTH